MRAGGEHPAWRQWGRRLSLLALLGGVGYLVLHMLGARPVALQVAYHWGSARDGLAEATVVYRRDGQVVRRVRFNYARPAPVEQTHPIQIQPGDYDLDIGLAYRGSPPRISGGRVEGSVLRLRRPLIVAGEGAVRVVLVE